MIFSGWFYDSSARGSRTKRDSYKSDACVTDLTRVRTDLKTCLLWSSPACASALNVYVQLISTRGCINLTMRGLLLTHICIVHCATDVYGLARGYQRVNAVVSTCVHRSLCKSAPISMHVHIDLNARVHGSLCACAPISSAHHVCT